MTDYDPFRDDDDSDHGVVLDAYHEEEDELDEIPNKKKAPEKAKEPVPNTSRYDAIGSCSLGEEFGKCDPTIFQHGIPIIASQIGKAATEQVCAACKRRGLNMDWHFTGITRIIVKCHPSEDVYECLSAWSSEYHRYLIEFEKENIRADASYTKRLMKVREAFSDPMSYPGFPKEPETRHLEAAVV